MSTNNFPRISAILANIPDAATRWPEWFWPTCPECGEECDLDAHDDPFCCNPDCHVHFEQITPVPKFAPVIDEAAIDAWHGDDLAPRNMHHLWAMLEAVCTSKWSPSFHSDGAGTYLVANIVEHTRYGRGPNIIEAMLRCLEEATR